MEKEKLEPFPFSLSTAIVPPINSTSCLQIFSPSPVPPYCLEMEASTCEKLWNSLSSSFLSMPIPVSITKKNSSILSFTWAVLTTSTQIFPIAVNFTALLIKLFNIWTIRSSSPITYSGISSEMEKMKSSPFSVTFLIWLSFI